MEERKEGQITELTNELLGQIFKCLHHRAHSIFLLFISTTPSHKNPILNGLVCPQTHEHAGLFFHSTPQPLPVHLQGPDEVSPPPTVSVKTALSRRLQL